MVAVVCVGFASRRLPADEVDYDRDIRPILSDNCYQCHGPDAAQRQADLRLDDEEAAKKHAIVPNSPEESELVARICSSDAAERMPPPESKLRLASHEIEIIKKWIQEGAGWSEHWSFRPLVSPEIPQIPPIVGNGGNNGNEGNQRRAGSSYSGERNPVDRFVLRRLSKIGRKFSPAANPETILRRVSFDLTGLPPTLSELDRFLDAGDQAEAYAEAVDRLLDSPRFGERLATIWLDLARYSDTFGYQVDRDRFVWPWRDWVIRAFNENMPYDQFITEQLAGDLLPDATEDQILATTFNRLHPQKVEGGSVPEEFRIEYVADRTQTFATSMLGLTMECCRCHDHKYDPLSQREYYQLSAFFDNIDEAGLYSYFTDSVPTPTLSLLDDSTQKKLAAARAAVEQAEQTLRRLEGSDEFCRWRRSLEAPLGKLASPLVRLDFEEIPAGENRRANGVVGKAIQLTGDDEFKLEVGNFPRHQPFSVALWMQTPRPFDRAVVFHRSQAWTDAGSRGYQLLIEDGRLSASLIHFWPGNAIRIVTSDTVAINKWVHVAVTYDGSSRADGLRIYVDGRLAQTSVVRDTLTKQITGGGEDGDNLRIGARYRDHGFSEGLVDEFMVFDRRLSGLEVTGLHRRDEALAVNPLPANADGQEQAAHEFFVLAHYPKYQQALKDLQAVRKELCDLQDSTREIMVMRELPEGRDTHLLQRGDYSARGELVTADTPSILPAFPANAPRNRRGLARWLTTPSHPLTARVAVNRFWQMLFGEGFVRTPEDFGSQGQRPTDQTLLDWLAADFVQHGWDVKRLLRQIVSSSTYRQSSWADEDLFLHDPENRWLARGPSYRLPAEMLRDNALAVSGLLVDQLGGAPVKPYELQYSFKPATPDQGQGLYRRSLYTYWRRTAPAPAMMALGAIKRDVCRVKRERTASPLEALVLLNGPQYVEASRGLAEKLIAEFTTDDERILTHLFRTLTSRHPSQQESHILSRLYESQRSHFLKYPAKADAYLGVGATPHDPNVVKVRLAAWASVANTLMNYDECVTKR